MYDDDDIFAGDADIEMAALQDTADREDWLKSNGICAHGWVQNHKDGTCACLDCGKTFPSFEALDDERQEILL